MDEDYIVVRKQGNNILYVKYEQHCCRYYIEGEEKTIHAWKDEISDNYPPAGYGTTFTQKNPTTLTGYRFLTCD